MFPKVRTIKSRSERRRDNLTWFQAFIKAYTSKGTTSGSGGRSNGIYYNSNSSSSQNNNNQGLRAQLSQNKYLSKLWGRNHSNNNNNNESTSSKNSNNTDDNC